MPVSNGGIESIQPVQTVSMDRQMPSILFSNARAPVTQLVRASDRSSEDPGSNSGWISIVKIYDVLKSVLCQTT